METMADTATRTETEIVLDWRRECALDLGFTLDQANQLAESKIADLHQARRLLNLGCDHELATRILA